MIYFASLTDFLAMGGYGLYVWGSFLMTGALLLAETLLLKKSRRRIIRELQQD